MKLYSKYIEIAQRSPQSRVNHTRYRYHNVDVTTIATLEKQTLPRYTPLFLETTYSKHLRLR